MMKLTEATGGPPEPPRKTALGYSNPGGGKWPRFPFLKVGTKEWYVRKRAAGIPWREIDTDLMMRNHITRKEIDDEVSRRGGKS